MRFPLRVVEDDNVDRLQVEAVRAVKLSSTNYPNAFHVQKTLSKISYYNFTSSQMHVKDIAP